jgi:NAD(P)-dependent dehydrogenase (short-subunit alcohol dehydrogenase family)
MTSYLNPPRRPGATSGGQPSYLNPPPLATTGRRLEGRVVIVTGASSGIGAAAVRRFATEGACVTATARRADRLDELVGSVNEHGGRALGVASDVGDEESVRAVVATTVERFGRLDGAFNNAGIWGGGRLLHELDSSMFDAVVRTNLRGMFLCMKYEIEAMLQTGGGSIVNTSSTGGLVGGHLFSDYSAAKFGLAGLVKCAAVEYARRGIRVNAIAPGPTDTEVLALLSPTEEAREEMAGMFPMNFIADPDDMARAALFLLSDESRWTTGTILPCEGGFTAQ